MRVQTIIAAAAAAAVLGAAGAASASVYTFVGSWFVGDGPNWQTGPDPLSALETAALLFGGNPSDYAISTNGTDPTLINFMAHVDGYGDSQYLYGTVPENFVVDGGTPGVYDYSFDNSGFHPDYSAYVNDHSCFNRYGNPGATCGENEPGHNFAFVAGGAAVPEPASWALMIGGFGLAGAALRRRRQVALAA